MCVGRSSMNVIKKLIFYVKIMAMLMMVSSGMMNPALAESSPPCCYVLLSNSSANYTLNTTEGPDFWNKDGNPIKDEAGNVSLGIVLNSGSNWILLSTNYSGISCRLKHLTEDINCTDPCTQNDGTKKDGLVEVPADPWAPQKNGSVAGQESNLNYLTIIIVPIIIIIITIIAVWKCEIHRKFCANTVDANSANTANGGFHAVDQEELNEACQDTCM